MTATNHGNRLTDDEIRALFVHRQMTDEDIRAVRDLIAVCARAATPEHPERAPAPEEPYCNLCGDGHSCDGRCAASITDGFVVGEPIDATDLIPLAAPTGAAAPTRCDVACDRCGQKGKPVVGTSGDGWWWTCEDRAGCEAFQQSAEWLGRKLAQVGDDGVSAGFAASPAGRAPTEDVRGETCPRCGAETRRHENDATMRYCSRCDISWAERPHAAGRAPARAGTTPQHKQNQGETTNGQPQEPLLKGDSPMTATIATLAHTLYSRKAEFVVAEQFTNESWPDGVTRAPAAEDGTSPAPAYFDDGGFMHDISEGDWVVRPAIGRAYVVRRYDFERDYIAV